MLLPATAIGAIGEGSPDWLQTAWLHVRAASDRLYIALYAALIIGFTFIYASVVFKPEDVADNLKKYGGFIQGYRPGARTAEYLDYVLTRLTMVGAMYLDIRLYSCLKS